MEGGPKDPNEKDFELGEEKPPLDKGAWSVDLNQPGAEQQSNEPTAKSEKEKKWKFSKIFSGVKGIGVKKATEEIVRAIKEVPENLNPKYQEAKEQLAKIKNSEIIQKIKNQKVFGVSVVGFLAGAGSTTALKLGARAVLGGSGGLLIGAITGAFASGTLGGIRAYRKECERIKNEGPATKEKLQSIAEKIRAEAEPDLLNRLDSYLALVENEEENSILTETKNELYQSLKKELRLESVNKREILKGIATGALIGGISGGIGGYLSSYLTEHLTGSGVKISVREELQEAGRSAKEAGKTLSKEALKAKVDAAAAEAYQKTYEKSLALGAASLKEQVFTAAAEKGEGATNAARKIIHDYIVERQTLGGFEDLSKAQLVYTEDSLRHFFEEGTVKTGDTFTVGGADVSDIIDKAHDLTKEQIQNLEKEWAPKISESAWEKIQDYSEHYDAANNFSDSITENAQREAANAAEAAAEEAGKNLAASPDISPQATAAKDAWFKRNLVKYGLLGAAVTGGAAAAYKWGDSIFEHAINIKEKTKAKVKTALQKRVHSLTPEEIKNENNIIEEENKKIAADPLINFYKNTGFDFKPEEVITYRGPTKEDLDKDNARTVIFTNYSDFKKEYLDGLTKQEKKQAHRYGSFGVWGPKDFWKYLENNPDMQIKASEIRNKALRGMLPDSYSGIPAKEDVPEERVDESRLNIKMDFKLGVDDAFRGFFQFYEIDAEDELDGLTKLYSALKMLPQNYLESMQKQRIFLKIGMDNRYDKYLIEINPYSSAEEIRDYLIGVLEQQNI